MKLIDNWWLIVRIKNLCPNVCLIWQGHDDAEFSETGEDARSIDRHLLDITQEMNKLRPDFNLVIDKVKRTLSVRLEIAALPVATTLQKFPWLKNAKLVSCEHFY